MTKEEMKEKIHCIRAKGYLDETDKHTLWAVYTELFGTFHGNLGCQECIRNAMQKITLKFENE